MAEKRGQPVELEVGAVDDDQTPIEAGQLGKQGPGAGELQAAADLDDGGHSG
jgi:hypothetical protein